MYVRSLPRESGGVGGWVVYMQFKVLRCRPKSHDTSRDSLFILKRATDFTVGRKFIKA